MFPQMLFLASTKRYFGFGDKDDHVVLDGGRVIGRIFQQPQAPEGRPSVLDDNSAWVSAINSQSRLLSDSVSKRWWISKRSG